MDNCIYETATGASPATRVLIHSRHVVVTPTEHASHAIGSHTVCTTLLHVETQYIQPYVQMYINCDKKEFGVH